MNPTSPNADIDRRELRREMAPFQHSSRVRSTWQLCNSLIPYALLWYLAYWTLQHSIWLTLPVIVLMAGFQVRIFIIFHDCGHQAFYRSRTANNFWGRLAGILTFTPYYRWSASHARHHGTSADLDKRGEGDVWMMTLEEYVKAPRAQQIQYRLYRNPLVMFLLGPLLITLINNRRAGKTANKKIRLSVYGTNLALAGFMAGMIYIVGWKAFFIIQVASLWLAHVAGVWLFYVQHQFEGVYWERSTGWDFVTASLEGGSFYKLPAVIRWFTGNIGYHHVHHLNPRIPNYNLPRCHNRVPILQAIKPIKLFSSLKSLRYRLWDEANSQMVGFRAATRLRNR